MQDVVLELDASAVCVWLCAMQFSRGEIAAKLFRAAGIDALGRSICFYAQSPAAVRALADKKTVVAAQWNT